MAGLIARLVALAVALGMTGVPPAYAWGGSVRSALEVAAQPAPAPPPPAEASGTGRNTDYSWEAVFLVALMLSLLGLLFWLLLRYSHQLEQASYLGKVYGESVQDFEYKRLASAPAERFQSGDYYREVMRDGEWLARNPQPEPEETIREIVGYFPGTPPPGLNLRPGSGLPSAGMPSRGFSRGESDDPAERQKTSRAIQKFEQERNAWTAKVEAEAEARYARDLQEARKQAKKNARSATNVDLSVLRGRGAEFVLEFTAVVVIIFAAVVLGVLDILDSQQIGTLLAAIAGYVLGRATTRTRPAQVGEAVTEDHPGDGRARRGEHPPSVRESTAEK